MSAQTDADLRESVDHRLRAGVVAAADELYYAHGFRAVGMNALARRAGVSLKLLYKLFPSKEFIVLAVLDHRHQMWSADLAAAVDQQVTPRARLLAIFDHLSGWFRTDSFRGCVFINAFGELATASPAVADKAARHKREFRRQMRLLAAEAGCSEELGDQLMFLAEGAQTTAAITGEPSMALTARRAAESLLSMEESARASSLP